jgi:hypothetical protein
MQPSTTSTTSSNLNHFVDVATGNRIMPFKGEMLDSEDCDIVGCDDEFGIWWGTERAAWVLSEQPNVVVVNGFIGPNAYVGYFVGTAEEARHYAKTHGVKDIEVDGVLPDPWA